MSKSKIEFKLGNEVVDNISGFKGIIIAKCEHLHGDVQYHVCGNTKSLSPPAQEWFDPGRLSILSKGIDK